MAITGLLAAGLASIWQHMAWSTSTPDAVEPCMILGIVIGTFLKRLRPRLVYAGWALLAAVSLAGVGVPFLALMGGLLVGVSLDTEGIPCLLLGAALGATLVP